MGILQQFESDAINGVITLSQQNEATIVTSFTAGEAWVAPMFANLLKQIPSIKGIYGYIANPLIADFETWIESQVAALLAKYNGQELYNLYIALLQHLASLVSTSTPTPVATPVVAAVAPKLT